MTVYRDQTKRGVVWKYKGWIRIPGEGRKHIKGTPKINTKVAAQTAERGHIERVLKIAKNPGQAKKEVPTLAAFAPIFVRQSKTRNKESSVKTKEQILRTHLEPLLGKKRLDRITFAIIQDYAGKKLEAGYKAKTVNNQLTVLRALLVLAKKRGAIAVVPEFDWLRTTKPDFDFLSFDEATGLVEAADEEWRTMILLGLRTGLRQGELIALRWEDTDLRSGQIRVCRAVSWGVLGTPKNGRERTVPLGDDMLVALERHGHRKGELVFPGPDGRFLTKGQCKWPLWRACRNGDLRRIGWHVLRHTFASHLTMRGAHMKVVQELLGHATLEMTMRYAHLSPNVPREAVKLLDKETFGSFLDPQPEGAG